MTSVDPLPGTPQASDPRADKEPPFVEGKAMFALVGLLLAVQILDGMDMHALAFVAVPLSQELGINRATLGACIGAAFLGTAFGAVVFGWLADRLGRKPMLLAAVILFGAGSGLTSLVADATSLFLMRFVTGVALGGVFPVAAALLIERVPSSSRTTAVSVMSVGTAGGSAMCGLVSSLVVPDYGWRAMFIVGGLLPLALVPLMIWILPSDTRPRTPAKVQGRSSRIRRPSLLRDGAWRTTFVIWAALLLCAFPVFFIIGWLPTIARDYGASPSSAAYAASLFGIMGALGGIFAGKIVDRFGIKGVVPITMGGAVSALVLAWTLGGDGFLVASAAAGFLIVAPLTLVGAVSGQFYDSSIRGMGVGSGLAVMRLGAALSPAISGVLLDAGLKTPILFGIGGLLVLLGGGMIALLARTPVVEPEIARPAGGSVARAASAAPLAAQDRS